MEQDTPVQLHFDGDVATIVLNRPHAMNALDLAACRAFAEAITRIGERSGLRAVVIRGAGKAFMAGADLAAVASDFDHAPQAIASMIDALHPAILALEQLPVPVLAAVHGAVAGAGFSLMLACDFVVAADNTRFSLAYARIAGSLDAGASWRLPRALGRGKALEIALLAEPFDAAEALRLGLVNEVAPIADFNAAVDTWRKRLAVGPTQSYGRIKTLLTSSYGNTLAEQLDAERAAFTACAASSDFREGVTAFLEKRPARFLGL